MVVKVTLYPEGSKLKVPQPDFRGSSRNYHVTNDHGSSQPAIVTGNEIVISS